MIYIGYKRKSLDFISGALDEYCTFSIKKFADLFAGTGIVSHYYGNRPDTEFILSNDIQYYSYVLLKALLTHKPSDYATPPPVKVKGFVYNNYAIDRKYFTPENAEYIDGYRSTIRVDDFHSIAALLHGVTKISNTACMYESYLKKYKKSCLPIISLK